MGARLEGYSLVEYLEKSSPLIIEEVRRWRDLHWDDYLDYKYHEKRSTDVDNPPTYLAGILGYRIQVVRFQ